MSDYLDRARELTDDPEEIRLGISACLLGDQVRFDAGHKRDDFLDRVLGPFVRYVPVCPELEAGLGVPRESIRLVRRGNGVRLVGVRSGTDRTAALRRYGRQAVPVLRRLALCGFVLKKDSPSCGLFRVRVYGKNDVPTKDGRGLFASALTEALPVLPVEEEGRLKDPRLRENFLERVFAYRRMRSLFQGRWSVGALVRFHTAEKLLLMAHDPKTYRELGRVVARARGRPRAELSAEYQRLFMTALAKLATPGRHANALQHAAGHLKDLLSGDERAELAGVIEDFRRGLTPLIVPVTLLRHFVRKYDVDYLQGQTYLEPHPKELMLRNHV